MNFNAHFIIAKQPFNAEGFRHISLRDGWILSCHDMLDLYYLPEKDALLLGIAWQTDEGRGSPEQELKKLPDGEIHEEDIIAMEETWCGNYVLIIGGRVFMDMCGMLGVFYSKAGISSSCALLAQAMALPETIYKLPVELCWFPSPNTCYEPIKKQLPSQVYDYRTHQVFGRELLPNHCVVEGNDDTKIEAFVNRFTVSLQNMHRRLPNKKLLIALTGGHDSRTLFALAHHAGIPFECYTIQHDDMPNGDSDLPRKLCEKINCPYHFIEQKKENFDSALVKEYEQATSGLIGDADRVTYAYGQYQQLIKQFGPVAFLRSGVWEASIDYYRLYIKGGYETSAICGCLGVENGTQEYASADVYARWCRQNEQQNISACNRVFMEQREGSWLSYIEQGYRLYAPSVSLQPVNCRALMEQLSAFSQSDRREKLHQEKIIAAACPEIKEIPYGNKMKTDDANVWTEFKAKYRRFVFRCRNMGAKKVLTLYFELVKKHISARRGH